MKYYDVNEDNLKRQYDEFVHGRFHGMEIPVSEGLEEFFSDDKGEIKKAMEESDWDLNRFFGERKYLLIHDVDKRNFFIRCYLFVDVIPACSYLDCDRHGSIDLFSHAADLTAPDCDCPLDESEILRLLFFAGESDIWDLMLQGVGDINSLWKYFSGATGKEMTYLLDADDNTAYSFLNYVLMHGGIKERDKEYFLVNTPERRYEAYLILVGMHHIDCEELLEDWEGTIEKIRKAKEYWREHTISYEEWEQEIIEQLHEVENEQKN